MDEIKDVRDWFRIFGSFLEEERKRRSKEITDLKRRAENIREYRSLLLSTSFPITFIKFLDVLWSDIINTLGREMDLPLITFISEKLLNEIADKYIVFDSNNEIKIGCGPHRILPVKTNDTLWSTTPLSNCEITLSELVEKINYNLSISRNSKLVGSIIDLKNAVGLFTLMSLPLLATGKIREKVNHFILLDKKLIADERLKNYNTYVYYIMRLMIEKNLFSENGRKNILNFLLTEEGHDHILLAVIYDVIKILLSDLGRESGLEATLLRPLDAGLRDIEYGSLKFKDIFDPPIFISHNELILPESFKNVASYETRDFIIDSMTGIIEDIRALSDNFKEFISLIAEIAIPASLSDFDAIRDDLLRGLYSRLKGFVKEDFRSVGLVIRVYPNAPLLIPTMINIKAGVSKGDFLKFLEDNISRDDGLISDVKSSLKDLVELETNNRIKSYMSIFLDENKG